MISNKNFKKTILNDFNKKENLKNIMNKLEKKESGKMKKQIYKYGTVFGCLILLVMCSVLIINNHKELKPIIENENSIIYINKIDSTSISKLDADIKMTNENIGVKGGRFEYIQELEEYSFYKDLIIPEEYNAFSIYGIYVKSNLANNEYDKLNNYVLSYKVKDVDKEYKDITISFSKENTPLRDYYFTSDDDKPSIINDVELKIYQSEKSYMTMFTYNDINFDIETYNINQEELMSLLYQIIK